MMNPHEESLFLEVERRDKNGKILERLRTPSKSFLKNWRLLDECFIRGATTTIVDTLGNPVSQGTPGASATIQAINASEHEAYFGIAVGKGNQAVNAVDFDLQTPIGDGQGLSESPHTPNLALVRSDKNNLKASGTSLVITLGGNYPAGSTVFVAIANNLVTATGWSVVDTAGNTYAQDSVGGTTGICTGIFRASNISALTAGNTITITLPSSSAKAAVSACFTGIMKTLPADSLQFTSATTSSSGTSVNSNSSGVQTLVAPDCVLFSAIGIAGDIAMSAGVAGNMTLIDKDGTTGGANNTNAMIMAAYRVVSVMSEYTDSASWGTGSSSSYRWGGYRLAVPTLSFGVMQFTAPVIAGGTVTNEYFRVFTNQSGTTIVMPEYGIKVRGAGGVLGGAGGSRYLIVRDVLGTPVTLLDTQSLQVKYVHSVTV